MSPVDDRFLAGVEPFTKLPASKRAPLVKLAQEKRYAKGETIFREGQPSDFVWIVKAGRVHLMRFLPDGKASTTCVMAPGELFCCLPAMDRRPYPADAVAADNSVVVRIPMPAFHQAMGESPGFRQEAICLFCDRLRQVEGAGCMMLEPVERRLARVLLTLSKKFGATIPLTRLELAELAGTTNETVIRTLSRFRRDGLIRSTRGHTTLLQPEKLQALLTTCAH